MATPATPAPGLAAPAPAAPPSPQPPGLNRRRKILVGGMILLAVLLLLVTQWLRSRHIITTDDAYVNGHVTFVAPRVPGQVARVLVEDNNRVHKGDLLVQLDKTPYQMQVDIAFAAVAAAEADLVVAQAQVRGEAARARSLRFNLERSIEDVDNQVALLRSKVAALASQTATMNQKQAEFDRASQLVDAGVVTRQEWERANEALLVAKAQAEQALQGVYQIRVALGLPLKPETGADLAQVPDELDQTFSSVKQAQATLMQAIAPLGVFTSFNMTPKEMVAEFYKRDPEGNIDRIYAELLKDAPAVKQAEARLAQAQRLLDQAKLNLSYCDVVAEIDGVVTRRNVNPGNNVVAGQSLMAVRSLTEIWVDANFKETQLARLRIGQPVDIEADMYGRRQKFTGRISGFTIGTGSTLALLPAQNATGNFVKVVQRLPVRIELVDYDPEQTPLFIGLSVTPSVHVNAAPTGPDAGKILQPYLPAGSPAVAPVPQS